MHFEGKVISVSVPMRNIPLVSSLLCVHKAIIWTVLIVELLAPGPGVSTFPLSRSTRPGCSSSRCRHQPLLGICSSRSSSLGRCRWRWRRSRCSTSGRQGGCFRRNLESGKSWFEANSVQVANPWRLVTSSLSHNPQNQSWVLSYPRHNNW